MNQLIYTFGKNDHLKGVKNVSLLFEEGKSLFSHPFKIVWRFTETHPGISTCTGISIPKKRFRRAVDRNRIKRIFRESWRHRKADVDELVWKHNKGIDIMFIYIGREIPSLIIMDSYIDKAIAKFSLFLKPEIKKADNPEDLLSRI